MKTLFKIMALFMLLFNFAACGDDDEEVQIQQLPVNYANLDGTWKLTEWNGQALPEGNYVYISFTRRDHTFKIYQKMDSMYARLITGTFTIEEDEYLGYVINGEYDYDNGDWNNKYIVVLLENGTMTWTVKDDEEDVSRYERCDAIPDEILKETENL